MLLKLSALNHCINSLKGGFYIFLVPSIEKNSILFFIGRLPQTMRLAAALGLPPYRVFTLEEIEDLTNNFDLSNLIGEGSQGQVKAFDSNC